MKKKLFRTLMLVILVVLTAGCGMFLYKSKPTRDVFYGEKDIKYANKIIRSIGTDKAIYNVGEDVLLRIDLFNESVERRVGDIYVKTWDIGEIVKEEHLGEITLDANKGETLEKYIKLNSKDFKGYLLEVVFRKGREVYDMETIGVDVSSDWTKFPRYGYVSSFHEETQAGINAVGERLNKFHINGVQFYDWQHKHEEPLALENGQLKDQWIEIANRKIDKDVVKGYIEEFKQYGTASMNYNLLFGAWKNFEEAGVKKEWGLFKDKNGKNLDYHPLPDDWASNKIYLMNPGNEQWQKFIIDKEKEVLDYFDFDGWHIDQLGSRDSLYDFQGNRLNLEKEYGKFFTALNKEFGDNKIAFNAVNGYGQKELASSGAGDFLYVEVWDTDSLHRLKYFIEEGQRLTDYEKNVVIAGYMNYKAEGKEFNEHSVKLANATIIASGGSHIEIGDSGMLSHEYFPNDKMKVGKKLEKDMVEYYDFMVAYENILRDMVKPKNVDIKIEGTNSDSRVKAKNVWYFGKEKESKTMIHLINLLQSETRNWRDDEATQMEPDELENFELKYYTGDSIKEVKIATPDFEESRMRKLKFSKGKDDKGQYISVNIPKLKYWDMIVFEK